MSQKAYQALTPFGQSDEPGMEKTPSAQQQARLPMLHHQLCLLLACIVAACTPQDAQPPASPVKTQTPSASQETKPTPPLSLVETRRDFKTVLLPSQSQGDAISVEKAPQKIFHTVQYQAPQGALAAYISPDPGGGRKSPAIIWIQGGDTNSIGDVWSANPRNNDQSAAAYRQAGIVMMFPSLRGGNGQSGNKEGFLGEVDDVLAALKYLEQQPYVDPKRIYLGGHSTGGTLALLAAESSDRFRAVFAFGPVADVSSYGNPSSLLPFNVSNEQEVLLRSPGYWLPFIQSPVWVFEGTKGNIEDLKAMAKVSKNPKAHFFEIAGANHFNVLAPTNELIAKKILQDTGEGSQLSFTEEEVNRNFKP